MTKKHRQQLKGLFAHECRGPKSKIQLNRSALKDSRRGTSLASVPSGYPRHLLACGCIFYMTHWLSMADLLQDPHLHMERLFQVRAPSQAPGMRAWVYLGDITPHQTRNVWSMLEALGCGVSTYPWKRMLAERSPAKS